MDEARLEKLQEEIDPRYGELLMYWTMEEYEAYQRSGLWYAIFAVVGIGLILYAILAANYIFAVFLVLAGIFMLWQHMRDPDQIPIVILSAGMAIGNHFHAWDDVKDFAIAYDPPEVRKLYVDFIKDRDPYVSITLPEDMNPNELRALMLEYAKENPKRREESLTDYVRRLYKL